jgi:hypothetical protein
LGESVVRLGKQLVKPNSGQESPEIAPRRSPVRVRLAPSPGIRGLYAGFGRSAVWGVAVLRGRGELRGNTSLLDRRLCVDSRLLFELVDDVAVAPQGQAGVMPELAGDVDHPAALVEQQRGMP